MRLDIRQLEFIDKDLRELVLWLEEETGLDFLGTSLFRMTGVGVHTTLPLRGIDLRMRDRRVGKVLEEIINESWLYDPTRISKQCALLHGEGSNLHLHLQTHPATQYIGE